MRTAAFIILSFVLLLVPALIHAQDAGPINVNITNPPPTGTKLGDYINSLYQSSLGLGALAAFIMITAGGIFYAVSGAINQKQEGIDIIKSAIFGIVLLFGAVVIFNTINPRITELKDPAASPRNLPQANYFALAGDYTCPNPDTKLTKLKYNCTTSGDPCEAIIEYYVPFYPVYNKTLAALSIGNSAAGYAATTDPNQINANVKDYRDKSAHQISTVAKTEIFNSVPRENVENDKCVDGIPSQTINTPHKTFSYSDGTSAYYIKCPNVDLLERNATTKKMTYDIMLYGLNAQDSYEFKNHCSETLTLEEVQSVFPNITAFDCKRTTTLKDLFKAYAFDFSGNVFCVPKKIKLDTGAERDVEAVDFTNIFNGFPVP